MMTPDICFHQSFSVTPAWRVEVAEKECNLLVDRWITLFLPLDASSSGQTVPLALSRFRPPVRFPNAVKPIPDSRFQIPN